MGKDAHLVNIDQQTCKSCQPDKAREQLQVVVELDIIDDRSHFEILACFGLCTVFGSQPPQRRSHQHIVMGLKAFNVAGDHSCKVETTDKLLKRLETIVDFPRDVYVRSAGRPQLMVQLRDPALNDVGQRASVGLGPSCKIAHQFSVEVASLPARPVKPAFSVTSACATTNLRSRATVRAKLRKKLLPAP